MAQLNELLNTSVEVPNRDIIEPFNAPPALLERLKDFFPESVYNLTESSFVYKFLLALLGDSGVGGMKKALLYPRLQYILSSTYFNDLDRLFTDQLGFPRLKDEIYTIDPTDTALTQQGVYQGNVLQEDGWAQIKRKDAWYKARCLDYMRAVQSGVTLEGMALMAKAATGVRASIFERWMHLDDAISDEPIGVPNFGMTNSRDEVVVRPQTTLLDQRDLHRLADAFDRFKPSNVFISYGTAGTNLNEIVPGTITASSNYFYVTRNVTGNSLNTYPEVSDLYNTWVEPGVQKEAPTLAFSDRSESITYPTIEGASASSYHIGPFSGFQRNLFSHLSQVPETKFQFIPSESYADTPVNYEVNTPWIIRKNDPTIMVNNHYPIGYFGDPNVAEVLPNKKLFWASNEEYPDVTDYLYLDTQIVRPVNLIEFEICQKPIDIEVEYLTTTGEWEPVALRTDVESTTAVFYQNSQGYSWQFVEIHFEAIQTNNIRIAFTRRPDPFPYSYSELQPWSIDVRNLRLAHLMLKEDDFVVDRGTDILGNGYQTGIVKYPASNVVDGNLNTFWQSQANPSRNAVESLYFDMRVGGSAQTFDELAIDPITIGCLMHIYFSDDEEQADWDYKLWTPVSRHYTLIKGNIQLPNPITCKFVKLEFTRLSVTPYPTLYKNNMPKMRYRTHPTWVLEYVQSVTKAMERMKKNQVSTEEVVHSYETLGIRKPTMTKLTDEAHRTIQDFVDENIQSTVFADYQKWKTDKKVAKTDEESVNVYTNLFQERLLSTIQSSNLQTELALANDNPEFAQETPLRQKVLLPLVSRTDANELAQKKALPDTWFPKTCRHGYKVIETNREFKIAFYVAIREVKFYRRDQQAKFDNNNYFETLSDSSNYETNTFVSSDWRYTVSPVVQNISGRQIIPQYGFESFDGITFDTSGITQGETPVDPGVGGGSVGDEPILLGM